MSIQWYDKAAADAQLAGKVSLPGTGVNALTGCVHPSGYGMVPTLTDSGTAATNRAALVQAIADAISASATIYMDAATYAVDEPIDFRGNNLQLKAFGKLTKLVQITDNVPVILTGGFRQNIEGLTLSYLNPQPSANTSANAWTIYTSFGSSFRNMHIEQCGRGIYLAQGGWNGATSNVVFSCHFDTISIDGFSNSAVKLNSWPSGSVASTGNVFTNIYVQNNFTGTIAGNAEAVLDMSDFEDSVFNQFNAEWTSLTNDSVVHFNRCRNMVINSFHVEQVTIGGHHGIIRAFDDCLLTVDGLTIETTTFANDASAKAIFMLGQGSASVRMRANGVRIRNVITTGVTALPLVELDTSSSSGNIEITGADTGSLIGPWVLNDQVRAPLVSRINGINYATFVGSTPNVVQPGTAAPVANAWVAGDRIVNTAPSDGSPAEWVCVTSGTPGTWVGVYAGAPTELINDTAASSSTVYSSTKTAAAITAAVTALVNAAPGALDTLKELADAMGDDANFSATVTTALAGKNPTLADSSAWTPSSTSGPLGSGVGSTTSYPAGSVVASLGGRWARKAAGNETVFTRSNWTRLASTNSQGLYVPDTFGQFWFPALATAKAGSGLARIGVVGDSVAVGYYASNLDTKSWAGLLKAALQTYGGDGGSGHKGLYENNGGGLSGDSVNAGLISAWATAGCVVALTGSWTYNMSTFDGPGFSPMRTQASGATATYTVRGRKVGVRVLQRTTGATGFTVQVDANSAVTINLTTGVATDGNYSIVGSTAAGIGTYEIDLGSGQTGTHTVVVTNGSASTLDVCAIYGRNTAGVVVDKYAHGGFPSHALADSTASPVQVGTSLAMTAATDIITKSGHGLSYGAQVLLSSITGTLGTTTTYSTYYVVNPTATTFQLATSPGGPVIDITVDGTCTVVAFNSSSFVNGTGVWGANTAAGTFGLPGKWSGGSANPCDLLIYSMGLNDAGAVQTDPAVWERNARNYLNDVLDGTGQTGQTDILFLLPHPGQIEIGRTTVGLYSEYAARARGLAEFYKAAFINLGAAVGRNSWNYFNGQSYWGLNGTPAGNSGTEAVHLSDAGHQAYFNALAPLLITA